MATLVAGMASSHAFTFMTPPEWERLREFAREFYKKRWGSYPPVLPLESMEEATMRYSRVAAGLDALRAELAAVRPDALIVVGDDQNEHFRDFSPHIALYTGDSLVTHERLNLDTAAAAERPVRHACDPELARFLVAGLTERSFDVVNCRAFEKDRCIAHAFTPILETISGPLGIPVVLVFVNSVHLPALTPKRCYALGAALAEIAAESGKRVAFYGSGGLSHFNAGYPYDQYRGPHRWGAMVADFDRRILRLLEEGKSAQLAELTSEDLLDNGELELRSWITVAGAMGSRRLHTLAYEPISRASMAMGVARWKMD